MEHERGAELALQRAVESAERPVPHAAEHVREVQRVPRDDLEPALAVGRRQPVDLAPEPAPSTSKRPKIGVSMYPRMRVLSKSQITAVVAWRSRLCGMRTQVDGRPRLPSGARYDGRAARPSCGGAGIAGATRSVRSPE
jgi:hypothetical protein